MSWGAGTPFRLGVRVADDGTRRGTVEVECHVCGRVGQWAFADKPSPQHATKHFARMGWQINDRKRIAICHSCTTEVKRRVDAAMPALIPPAQPVKENGTMTTTTVLPVLTTEKKAAVRLLLDKHFDDAAGHYLDGYSDQRIGTEANVPWASVKQLRELAYGPLREPTELEALRAEVLKSFDKASGMISGLAARIDADHRALRDKIEALAKKLGHE